MRTIRITPTFEAWRDTARALLSERVPPAALCWTDTSQPAGELPFSGPHETPRPAPEGTNSFRTSKAFLHLARAVSCHREASRWALLYRALWRMTCNAERHLLELSTDPDVRALELLAGAVRRDCHKMHAFVRFRKIGEHSGTGREHFVAWYEPGHDIAAYNAPFFVKRFTGMDWSILTPYACLHWDGNELLVTPGAHKSQAPAEDALDDLWRTYYRNIFNPARLKLKAMQAEMPKKYWKNLPEARLIHGLTTRASEREHAMITRPPTEPRPAPANPYLQSLQELNGEKSLDKPS